MYFDQQRRVDRSSLEAMNEMIVHRGPDDAGFYIAGNVGIAIRRLSIIDLQTGHQPLTNEDETAWIVYNGEIYNHSDLRQDLEARGHRYRTQSDTETIVHLYDEYGPECVQHLRGMFAFVIWDMRFRRLFAARDRLGIKPFYYLQTPQLFLFGSEIKALLAYPGVRAELHHAGLPEYLAFGYLSGAETLFAGIKKLLPGHTLQLTETGEPKIEPYWDLPPPNSARSHPKSYYIKNYRDLVEQAVASHLMSDVPLGVFLSGGIDSSVVAALMTKIRRAPIETFSVGYDEEPYSELPYARAVAAHLGSHHHEVQISQEDFFEALPKLIWHEDEPIVWPSSVPLYFVAKLAREFVTVVLTGEGSDETLAGYTRYPMTLWNARLDRVYRLVVPSRLRRLIRESLFDLKVLSAESNRKLRHAFFARDGASWISLYFDNFYSAFSEAEQSHVLTDELRGTSGTPYRNALAYWEKASGELINRLLYTDIKTYLVELLMKQDSMSMAASIESRVPFLDHVLVEFAANIPAHYQTRGLAGKRILKQAARGLLPASILYRRKMGFPTPWRAWLTGDQLDAMERLLIDPRTIGRGLFKADGLRRIFAEHRSRTRDHYDRIWRLLNLEIWHRAFIEREPVSVEELVSAG